MDDSMDEVKSSYESSNGSSNNNHLIASSEQLAAATAPPPPTAPVRPKSGFLHFSAAHRAKLKAAFPDLAYAPPTHTTLTIRSSVPALVPKPAATFSELARLLGWEWRRMNEEQRKPWERMAEEEKQRYKQEMARYSGKATKPSNQPSSKKRRSNELNPSRKKVKRQSTAAMDDSTAMIDVDDMPLSSFVDSYTAAADTTSSTRHSHTPPAAISNDG